MARNTRNTSSNTPAEVEVPEVPTWDGPEFLTPADIAGMDKVAREAFIENVAYVYSETERRTKVEKDNATDRAANATYLAWDMGLILQEKTKDNHLTNAQWAEKFGAASKSLATNWLVLGFALARIEGLTRESEVYLNMRNTNQMGQGKVRAHVLSGEATVESLTEVLSEYIEVAEDGKVTRKKGTRAARPGMATPSSAEETEQVTAITDATTAEDKVKAAWAFLKAHAVEMTLDQWAEFEPAAREWLDKRNTTLAQEAAGVKQSA
jgi:hypothetical protein